MFATFILAILWNSLNARTESLNLFEHITENRNFIVVMLLVTVVQILIIQEGGQVFGTTPLTVDQWIKMISIAFLIVPIDIIRKIVVKNLNIKE